MDGVSSVARTMVVGTAGHVDHGKSALVKALTGIDPDRLKEEQARGITIDLGFADAWLGDVHVAFVDVPGHERFIHNMLAGATAVDAVLLVIAADEGVRPQTLEHFEICRLLGLTRGVVVITKSDLVDEARLASIVQEARGLVVHSFLEDAVILPVSVRTGAGLDALRAALVDMAAQPRRRPVSSTVRLAVDRSFAKKGFGTIVTGTLTGGRIAVGDALDLLPAARRVRVRGLQVHGQIVTSADAPRRVAVNLAGADAGDVPRGTTLARPETLAVVRHADVILGILPGGRVLRHGAVVRVHAATAERGARVVVAAARFSANADWRFAGPRDVGVEIPSGGEGLCRLRFDAPMVLARGDRLILRSASPSITIGGGRVLDVEPPRKGLRTAAGRARLRAIEAENAEILTIWLAEAGARGLEVDDLVRRTGGGVDEIDQAVEALVREGRVRRTGAAVFDASAAEALERGIERALTTFHAQDPASEGLAPASLRGLVGPGVSSIFFDLAIDTLAARGVIRGRDRLALSSHVVQKTSPDASIETVEAALRAAGLSPPDEAELSSIVGRPPDVVARAIERLARERRVIRLGSLTFHLEALEGLAAGVRARASAEPSARVLDIGTFKARYGLSRKFAIPLLEWLDRSHVTRRTGDRRIVL